MNYRFAPFLVMGVAFLAIGIAAQRAFLYIGLVFILLALVMMVRGRRL